MSKLSSDIENLNNDLKNLKFELDTIKADLVNIASKIQEYKVQIGLLNDQLKALDEREQLI